MSYGAIFKNGSDFVLIDDAYQNHEVKASGSLYVASDGSTLAMDISSYGVGALLFLRNTTGYYLVFGLGYLSLVNSAGTRYAGTVEWAVTAPASSAPSGGYGLNVHAAGGQLVYSSQRSYLLIAQTSKLTFNAAGEASAAVAVGTPMIDAAPMLRYYWMTQSGGYGEPSGFVVAGFHTSGSTFYVKLFHWNFSIYSTGIGTVPAGTGARFIFAR